MKMGSYFTGGLSPGTAKAGKALIADAASAAGRAVCEQFVCSIANYTAADSAAAQKVFNSPANGTLAVLGSTTYFFEAQYVISNTGTTSHTWATLFALGGGASLAAIAYLARARSGTTSAVTLTAVSDAYVAVATAVPVTAASTSATEFVVIGLRGVFRTNAGGTITPQIQASAQPGLTGTPGVVVLAGSFFRCWPVGDGAVVSVGNWT